MVGILEVDGVLCGSGVEAVVGGPHTDARAEGTGGTIMKQEREKQKQTNNPSLIRQITVQ